MCRYGVGASTLIRSAEILRSWFFVNLISHPNFYILNGHQLSPRETHISSRRSLPGSRTPGNREKDKGYVHPTKQRIRKIYSSMDRGRGPEDSTSSRNQKRREMFSVRGRWKE